MISKNKIIAYSFTFLSTILILLSFTLSGNAQTLYSCESATGGDVPFLNIVDTTTLATLNTAEIQLAGETVRGCNGMARHPQTGVCYIILNVNPDTDEPVPPRILATINPITGIASAIGNAQETFASITFDSNGTLYGVTGDGGATPETLFTISLSNGAPTFVQTLGNGDDGEAIAFNPNDGLIYHASGFTVFESINPDNGVITPITLSGPISGDEQTALVHQSGNVLLAAGFSEINTLTTSGNSTFVGFLDHDTKGLAFDCAVPPSNVPTLSEWGLITMAGILGIVGFLVMRRRKVTA